MPSFQAEDHIAQKHSAMPAYGDAVICLLHHTCEHYWNYSAVVIQMKRHG
jgi:hypothetical protein